MIHPIRSCLLVLLCLGLAACGRLPASGPASNEILNQVSRDNNEFALYQVNRSFLPTVQQWPVTGATELVQISMAGIIFFALPAMFLRDDQVVVDLFSFVRRGWFGWIVTLAFSIATVAAVWIIAERVSGYAIRAWEDGDETIYLKIPTYLVVWAITIMIYLSGVFAAVRAIRMICAPGRLIPDETGTREHTE